MVYSQNGYFFPQWKTSKETKSYLNPTLRQTFLCLYIGVCRIHCCWFEDNRCRRRGVIFQYKCSYSNYFDM